MDLKTAIKITMSITPSKHKLPEPLRLAHQLSKEQAQEPAKGAQIALNLFEKKDRHVQRDK